MFLSVLVVLHVYYYLISDELQESSSDFQQDFAELKGIEVAHAFLLGTKYSDALDAKFTCTDQSRQPMVMGCFGIGTTRLLAASIEVLSSSQKIRWPKLLAPYQICIIPQKVSL